MLFGLTPNYLAKYCGFFVVFSMFVLSFVVVRHILDNDRSHFLPQDVKLHLDKDVSL